MVFTLISKKEKKQSITLLLVDEKMMEDENKLVFISIFIVGPELSNLNLPYIVIKMVVNQMRNT